MIEKAVAGVAFLFQNAPLAQAGVHQQSEAQWLIAFPRKIIYGLGTAVFFQNEIVLAKIRNDFSMLVANRCQHAHRFHLDRNFPLRL